MRKSITKLMSFSLSLVFTFGLTIMPNSAEAGTVPWAKRGWHSIYGSIIYGGVELYGIEIPIGVTIDGGTDYIGEKEACTFWMFAECDDSNLQIRTVLPLHNATPF